MITPKDYVGAIMELSQGRRGDFVDMQYMTEERTTLVYDLPLAEVGKGGSERQRVPEGFWHACLAAAQGCSCRCCVGVWQTAAVRRSAPPWPVTRPR